MKNGHFLRIRLAGNTQLYGRKPMNCVFFKFPRFKFAGLVE